MNNPRELIDREIEWNGDRWSVGGVGVVEAGAVFCHLWSLTRTLCIQKNGRAVPVQSCDFVDLAAFGLAGVAQ